MERVDVLVAGASQAGLATGYHLQRQGPDFRIVDAASAPGHAWRSRWDSLVLFTSRRFSALPGCPTTCQAAGCTTATSWSTTPPG